MCVLVALDASCRAAYNSVPHPKLSPTLLTIVTENNFFFQFCSALYKCLLCAHHVPGIAVETEEKMMNKTESLLLTAV